jgi:hypothetical protein
MQTVGCSGQASQLNELSTAKSSLVSEFQFSLHKLMIECCEAMQSVGRCYLLSFLYNGYIVYASAGLCRLVFDIPKLFGHCIVVSCAKDNWRPGLYAILSFHFASSFSALVYDLDLSLTML